MSKTKYYRKNNILIERFIIDYKIGDLNLIDIIFKLNQTINCSFLSESSIYFRYLIIPSYNSFDLQSFYYIISLNLIHVIACTYFRFINYLN